MEILAISGSLRESSFNGAIVRAAKSLSPADVEVKIYDGLSRLPHFNPDLDSEEASVPVQEFRDKLRQADGILICTPEYAGGVPGVLKNALDWVVSSAELYQKPVAAISASPMETGGKHAFTSLLLTLSYVDARIPEGGAISIPFISKKLNQDKEISDPETLRAIRSVLDALVAEVSNGADR